MTQEKRHILLYGERGAGKSTLVEKLLQQCEVPIYGFFTRPGLRREDGSRSIYIFPAGSHHESMTAANRVGDVGPSGHKVNSQAFGCLGVAYLQTESDGIIVMDELGFLETESEAFCEKVLDCLDGDIPVLAVVKSKFQVEFLNIVLRHPKACAFEVTAENRDSLFQLLLPQIQQWNQVFGSINKTKTE